MFHFAQKSEVETFMKQSYYHRLKNMLKNMIIINRLVMKLNYVTKQYSLIKNLHKKQYEQY